MTNKYSDKEIVEGLLSTGDTLAFFEKYLFKEYAGLVKKGKDVHFLNKNDSLDCYEATLTDFKIKVKKGEFISGREIAPFLVDIFRKKCIDQKKLDIKNGGITRFMAGEYSDEEIIEGLMSPRIILAFFERYLFKKFNGLIRMGQKKYFLSENDSLDCYIDAFTDFVNKVKKGEFKTGKPIAPIFVDIFKKKCIDQMRRNSNLKNEGTADLDETSECKIRRGSPWAHFIRLDLIKIVRERMKSLSENCQQIIELWAEGYKYKEIVKILPQIKNENTAKSMKSQCLKKLKDICKDLF